jgi:hypothetical protein
LKVRDLEREREREKVIEKTGINGFSPLDQELARGVGGVLLAVVGSGSGSSGSRGRDRSSLDDPLDPRGLLDFLLFHRELDLKRV